MAFLSSKSRRGRRVFVGRVLALGTAAGLMLGLNTSCALWRHLHPKQKAGQAATAKAKPSPAASPAANASAAARAGGQDAGGQSPGEALLQHAVPDLPIATSRSAGASADTASAGTPPIAVGEHRIGVVRVIGALGKFVLVEARSGFSSADLPSGRELHCRGAVETGGAQTAVLRVSPERGDPFVVADVVTGEPHVGDNVYLPDEKPR